MTDTKHQPLPYYSQQSIEQLLLNCRIQGLRNARIGIAGRDAEELATKLRGEISESDSNIVILSLEGGDASQERRGREGDEKAGRALGEVEDEGLDSFIWASDKPLEKSHLKRIHAKIQMNGTLGMIRNTGSYNGSELTDDAAAWETRLATYLNESAPFEPDALGSQARSASDEWLAAFDEQIESGPIAITTSADPLFSLPVGRHEDNWTITLDRGQDGVKWVQQNCKSAEKVSREKWDEIVAGEQSAELTVHGKTVTVWTTKIPA